MAITGTTGSSPTTTTATASSKTTAFFTVEADPTRGIKVDVAKIASPYRQEIQASVQQLERQGVGT